MAELVHARGGAPVRLHALDLCRGLCALGVAAYHLSLWGGTELSPSARAALALLGTYGVSVFFILSGYSLAHAYERDFPGRIEPGPLGAYLRRRIGRLAPLFVVVLLATLAGKALLGGRSIDLPTFVANATLLFGFVNPAATPVVGGWSIGVEVVFYIVFPLLMVWPGRALPVLLAAALMTAWVSVDIASRPALADAWGSYVMPANHWIFFCAGVYARLHADRLRLASGTSLALIAACIVVATLSALGASELELVTGWRRALLVPLSVAVVALVGNLAVSHGGLQVLCSAMGGASYPLYLVHPLVFFALKSRLDMGTVTAWLGLVLAVLVLAFLADRFVDSSIQRRIKRMGW